MHSMLEPDGKKLINALFYKRMIKCHCARWSQWNLSLWKIVLLKEKWLLRASFGRKEVSAGHICLDCAFICPYWLVTIFSSLPLKMSISNAVSDHAGAHCSEKCLRVNHSPWICPWVSSGRAFIYCDIGVFHFRPIALLILAPISIKIYKLSLIKYSIQNIDLDPDFCSAGRFGWKLSRLEDLKSRFVILGSVCNKHFFNLHGKMRRVICKTNTISFLEYDYDFSSCWLSWLSCYSNCGKLKV